MILGLKDALILNALSYYDHHVLPSNDDDECGDGADKWLRINIRTQKGQGTSFNRYLYGFRHPSENVSSLV